MGQNSSQVAPQQREAIFISSADQLSPSASQFDKPSSEVEDMHERNLKRKRASERSEVGNASSVVDGANLHPSQQWLPVNAKSSKRPRLSTSNPSSLKVLSVAVGDRSLSKLHAAEGIGEASSDAILRSGLDFDHAAVARETIGEDLEAGPHPLDDVPSGDEKTASTLDAYRRTQNATPAVAPFTAKSRDLPGATVSVSVAHHNADQEQRVPSVTGAATRGSAVSKGNAPNVARKKSRKGTDSKKAATLLEKREKEKRRSPGDSGYSTVSTNVKPPICGGELVGVYIDRHDNLPSVNHSQNRTKQSLEKYSINPTSTLAEGKGRMVEQSTHAAKSPIIAQAIQVPSAPPVDPMKTQGSNDVHEQSKRKARIHEEQRREDAMLSMNASTLAQSKRPGRASRDAASQRISQSVSTEANWRRELRRVPGAGERLPRKSLPSSVGSLGQSLPSSVPHAVDSRVRSKTARKTVGSITELFTDRKKRLENTNAEQESSSNAPSGVQVSERNPAGNDIVFDTSQQRPPSKGPINVQMSATANEDATKADLAAHNPTSVKAKDSEPFKTKIVSLMNAIQRGERIVPPCDGCRRLKQPCLKHVTSCKHCATFHNRCTWKFVQEHEVAVAPRGEDLDKASIDMPARVGGRAETPAQAGKRKSGKAKASSKRNKTAKTQRQEGNTKPMLFFSSGAATIKVPNAQGGPSDSSDTEDDFDVPAQSTEQQLHFKDPEEQYKSRSGSREIRNDQRADAESQQNHTGPGSSKNGEEGEDSEETSHEAEKAAQAEQSFPESIEKRVESREESTFHCNLAEDFGDERPPFPIDREQADQPSDAVPAQEDEGSDSETNETNVEDARDAIQPSGLSSAQQSEDSDAEVETEAASEDESVDLLKPPESSSGEEETMFSSVQRTARSAPTSVKKAILSAAKARTERRKSAHLRRAASLGQAQFSNTTVKADPRVALSPNQLADLERFRKEYCAGNGLSSRQFADKIQANANQNKPLGHFWSLIIDYLEWPVDRRAALQKSIRRIYHNYRRERWTADEDAQLTSLYAELGPQWRRIADSLERMPEDVRDRFRNHVKGQGVYNAQKWSAEEELALMRAYATCAALRLDAQRREARRKGERWRGWEPDLSGLVVWSWVSERMGGVRSRAQCREKMVQLQRKGTFDLKTAVEAGIKGLKKRQARERKDQGRSDHWSAPDSIDADTSDVTDEASDNKDVEMADAEGEGGETEDEQDTRSKNSVGGETEDDTSDSHDDEADDEEE